MIVRNWGRNKWTKKIHISSKRKTAHLHIFFLAYPSVVLLFSKTNVLHKHTTIRAWFEVFSAEKQKVNCQGKCFFFTNLRGAFPVKICTLLTVTHTKKPVKDNKSTAKKYGQRKRKVVKKELISKLTCWYLVQQKASFLLQLSLLIWELNLQQQLLIEKKKSCH